MRQRFAITALAALLMAGTASQAQTFSAGAKLGMGFPGFIDERIASQRITLNLSVTGSLNVSKTFQIMSDVGYQRKGDKFTYQVWDEVHRKYIADSTYNVKTNLDYINIPLYLKLNFGHSSRFYLQAGGYYGYLVHANFTGKRSGEMVKKAPIRDGLYLSDYGVIAGGGLESPIRKGLGVILDVKYQYGLKDLNKDPLITGHSGAIKNKGLALGVGFYIDIE